MGFFDSCINLFRLSSPNARIYTFWGLTSLLLGTVLISYMWPKYLLGGESRRRLNWFRRKQLSQPEKNTIKVIPSPAAPAPAPSSAPSKTSTSNAAVVPPNTMKKEAPAAGGKSTVHRAVPPTPPPTPVDSPNVVPKSTATTTTKVSQVPPTTIVKETPKSSLQTTAPSTTKTEVEVKKDVAKHTILETEAEEKTKKREAVVQEVHHPVQVEEIQPVVHRDRIQKEVHQIIEPYHEEVVRPPNVIEREALPEHRPAEYAPTDNYKLQFEEGLKGVAPVQSFEDTQNVTIYNEPIVEEVVKKEVINVIQPVIQREVVEPTVIKVKQPIYEEVHEQPILYHEEKAVKNLGTIQTK